MFKNFQIVRSEWLQTSGRRLDSSPYMSGSLVARASLDRLSAKKERLDEITSRIYTSGRSGRVWVNSKGFGTPYMGSSAISLSDLSVLPLISNRQVERDGDLIVEEKWSLITRSGTVGRMAYVRPTMARLACSEHVLRIVPNESRILPGYLYAFLASKFGVPLVTSGTYGAIIQHIEPDHIRSLPVPRLSSELEQEVHHKIDLAAGLRSQFELQLQRATSLLLTSAGLPTCLPEAWHNRGDLGFEKSIGEISSLRAGNYSPRIAKLLKEVADSGSVFLGQICKDGQLGTGVRFKRIDCDPQEGVRLIGQKQGFWARPEGRWISAKFSPAGIHVDDETVLIASSGTLGENEVYCRSILATGNWLSFAYSQHFLRVVSGDLRFPGAYLFAFLRSELCFRALRSMSTGSKQQEILVDLVKKLPIPLLTPELRTEIAEIVRSAFRDRDLADHLEDKAIEAVESQIEEGARQWQE